MPRPRRSVSVLLAGLASAGTQAKEATDAALKTLAEGGKVELSQEEPGAMCYIMVEPAIDPGMVLLPGELGDHIRFENGNLRQDVDAEPTAFDTLLARCLAPLAQTDTTKVQLLVKRRDREKIVGVRVQRNASVLPQVTWDITPEDARLLAVWFSQERSRTHRWQAEGEEARRNPRLRRLLGP